MVLHKSSGSNLQGNNMEDVNETMFVDDFDLLEEIAVEEMETRYEQGFRCSCDWY